MGPKRDNFTKPTTEVLGKRVAYICSNPSCKRTTIGAHETENKSTSIGVAAHITAASNLGPRYDESLTPDERKHIDNGIWLCSNCATLIDKDPIRFSVELLRKWKTEAEKESWKKLSGEIPHQITERPFLEVDLIIRTRSRSNRGYSEKNPIEKLEGKYIMHLPNDNPIIYWGLSWHYSFVIFNNSLYPAYNVKIESIGTYHFSELDKLPKVNNLPPLKNIDLKARFEDMIEGDHTVVEKLMTSRVPEKLKKVKLKITYNDDRKNTYIGFIEVTEDGINNVSS